MRGFHTRRMSRGRMDSHRQGWRIRGVSRSRRNGVWDMRRGPRPETLARERWTESLIAHLVAMGQREQVAGVVI